MQIEVTLGSFKASAKDTRDTILSAEIGNNYAVVVERFFRGHNDFGLGLFSIDQDLEEVVRLIAEKGDICDRVGCTIYHCESIQSYIDKIVPKLFTKITRTYGHPFTRSKMPFTIKACDPMDIITVTKQGCCIDSGAHKPQTSSKASPRHTV